MEYNPQTIEQKWKQWWEKQGTYRVDNNSTLPKYYVLDMFPYPSGAGLHVGHPLGYIASDVFARYKRLQGFNVLHPMGYDAFGLPAEQYAITTGVHPAVSTAENIARYRQQLDNLGFSYDWNRQVNTSDPSYYKWTQWIFIQLFEHWYDTRLQKARPVTELAAWLESKGTEGLHAACSELLHFSASEWHLYTPAQKDEVLMNYRLAYRKQTFVNWCEALGTVLANDEVKDGVSERGGHPVERKAMLQWSLRITAYAERLLNDLDTLEWSEAMKKMQSNWIGRSEGAQVWFPLENSEEKLEVFTTRPDTLFGVTFMVIAPEHDWVPALTTPEQKASIDAYLEYTKSRSERERQADVKEVTGAFTGSYALHPISGERIPIWIAEYVLKDYGTGAIMAVPSDDTRDHAFAQKFGLPIVEVVDHSALPGTGIGDKSGVMINSGFLNGLEVMEAITKAIDVLEEKGLGKRRINYKLRDAIYSRQRYWGEPFPVYYDAQGVCHTLSVRDLPLELPDLDDFKPGSGAASPLARVPQWVNLENGSRRETDTMPGFAGSSWYFLRYMDPQNPEAFASPEALNYWKDVDLYIGGTEHAVGHLMYSRFWHKFLYDKGLVPTLEPFRKLFNQGMIQGIIESVYFQKSTKHFISAELAKNYDANDLTQILVHVDFVTDYGNMDNSHLNAEGMAKFRAWRPEYVDTQFVLAEGSDKLYTVSEVGKMSKSKYNVINPDDIVAEYGADVFRLYEMFLGPIEQSKPWNTKGISGVAGFMRKWWSLHFDASGSWAVNDENPTEKEYKALHTCIKKVSEDIDRLSMNTCVSAFMICANELKELGCRKRAILEPLCILIAPFAVHTAEELWHHMGHDGSVHQAQWPAFEAKYLVESTVTYPVSINGKKRALVELPANADKAALESTALTLPEIIKWTEGKEIKKIIVVPGKMINLVVNE